MTTKFLNSGHCNQKISHNFISFYAFNSSYLNLSSTRVAPMNGMPFLRPASFSQHRTAMVFGFLFPISITDLSLSQQIQVCAKSQWLPCDFYSSNVYAWSQQLLKLWFISNLPGVTQEARIENENTYCSSIFLLVITVCLCH